MYLLPLILFRCVPNSSASPEIEIFSNWWFRVAIHHERNADGIDILRFEHPTLAGVASGGWMEVNTNY